MTMFITYPHRVPATNAPLYWCSSDEASHRFTYLQFCPNPSAGEIEIDASYAMDEGFSVAAFNEMNHGSQLCFPIIPNATLSSIKALAHDSKLEAMLQRIADAYTDEKRGSEWWGTYPGLPEGFENEVIDHLATVLSKDAFKMVPAHEYVEGGNLELFILTDLGSISAYSEQLVELAEHEKVILVGDVEEAVCSWCAKEVEREIAVFADPDETLDMLVFIMRRHDMKKYGYLRELYNEKYPDHAVTLA